MRDIPLTDEGETFHGASKQALNALYYMFAETYYIQITQKYAPILKNIEHQPDSELDNIRNLANALLTFKQKVQASEIEFFRQKNSDKTSPYQKSISKLQDSSVWVERFHFLIEKFPDSMKSLGGDITTSLQT